MTNEQRLIFCTGAPGSSWSILIKQLAALPTVDTSDECERRTYKNHFGNYFGPGMEYGEFFDDLPASGCTRERLLEEFSKPYSRPQGDRFRMLKSHHFAYNLPFLRAMFPTSRFFLVWRSDDACLAWWLEAGGFDIPYPRYTWYRNIDVVREKIRDENARTLAFASNCNISLEPSPLEVSARKLGLLGPDELPDTIMLPAAPGVLTGVL